MTKASTAYGPRARAWRRLRLRRMLAALCWGLAVWFGLHALPGQAAAERSQVVCVSADLPVGHVLRDADLTLRSLPRDAVPANALTDLTAAVGRPLTSAASSGEVLTRARVDTDAASAAIPPGTRAVHVPLADPASAAGLSPGRHVDLVALADGTVIAADVVVVGIDRSTESGGFLPGPGSAGSAAGSAPGVTLAVASDKVGPILRAALGGSSGPDGATAPRGLQPVLRGRS